MNGGHAGGALAAGDAGKPGAPEDAAPACGYPEADGEGQRVPCRRCGESRGSSRCTDAKAPLYSPLPPAGRQRQRHLLASAQGLWRNHWPWRGGEVPHAAKVTTAMIWVIIIPYILSIPGAEGSPLSPKRFTSFPSNHTVSEAAWCWVSFLPQLLTKSYS